MIFPNISFAARPAPALAPVPFYRPSPVAPAIKNSGKGQSDTILNDSKLLESRFFLCEIHRAFPHISHYFRGRPPLRPSRELPLVRKSYARPSQEINNLPFFGRTGIRKYRSELETLITDNFQIVGT